MLSTQDQHSLKSHSAGRGTALSSLITSEAAQLSRHLQPWEGSLSQTWHCLFVIADRLPVLLRAMTASWTPVRWDSSHPRWHSGYEPQHSRSCLRLVLEPWNREELQSCWGPAVATAQSFPTLFY